MYVRGASKKFVEFVNKIKSAYPISLKLAYVCDQFNINKHRKFQTNRLLNVVAMTICLMRVRATSRADMSQFLVDCALFDKSMKLGTGVDL